MTIRRTMMAAASLALGACGGSKAPAPDTSAGMTPAPAAAVDSVLPDTAKPVADSTVKPGSPAAKKIDPKAAPGDHDVALKPKFTINEKTGKVDTIKRP